MTEIQAVVLEPDVALGLIISGWADRLDVYLSHILISVCHFLAFLSVVPF